MGPGARRGRTVERRTSRTAVRRSACLARGLIVLPEEVDVSLLSGLTVVEVGCRQAWPFLALIGEGGAREIRLYVDADVRVQGEGGGSSTKKTPDCWLRSGRSSTARSSALRSSHRLACCG